MQKLFVDTNTRHAAIETGFDKTVSLGAGIAGNVTRVPVGMLSTKILLPLDRMRWVSVPAGDPHRASIERPDMFKHDHKLMSHFVAARMLAVELLL